MSSKLVWSEGLHSRISLFEDPITGGRLAWESFIETYGKLLETLDGRDMSSYVDFFFEPSSLDTSIWVFVDEDAKLDFRDEAILMGLVPPIVDVMAGEDHTDAEERKERERAKEEQRRKQQKMPTSAAEKKRKQLMNAQLTVDKLSRQLLEEKDEKKIAALKSKLEKTLRVLSKHTVSI